MSRRRAALAAVLTTVAFGSAAASSAQAAGPSLCVNLHIAVSGAPGVDQAQCLPPA